MYTGENIKSARLYRGFTQKELAKQCGLATGTIQQYELNKRKPKIEQIVKIADILKLGYLLLEDGCVAFYDFVDTAPSSNTANAQKFNEQQSEILQKTKKYSDKFINEMYSEIRYMKQTETSDKSENFNLTKNEKNILSYMKTLNLIGQDKAVEQVELLTKIPEYQKKDD